MKASSPTSSQQQQQPRDLGVYDFDADEEAVEAVSERYTYRLHSKLSSRQRCGNGGEGYEAAADGLKGDALTKYDFLRYFNSGDTSEEGNLTGVWAVDLPESSHDLESCPTEVPDNNVDSAAKVELDETMRLSSSCDEGDQMSTDEFEDGSPEQAADVISEVDEGSCTLSPGSPSTADSDIEEHEGCSNCPVSGNFFMTFGHMVDDDVAIIVSPDYVIYGGTYYGESQLTFTSDYIKIECSDASGSDDKLLVERSSDDLIHIYCRWSGSVQAALVLLGLRAHTLTETDEPQSIPNVLQVKFSINDIHWLEKEHRIKNLSERYKNLWNSRSSDDSFWEDDAVDHVVLCSRDNFTETPHIFEDVVYPKGDPDAVSISKRDFELLQPETFINDTIIDFYIKYLKNKIQEDVKHRFHFFNSFFFRKLADLDKDRFNDSEGRAAFLRVRKWTRKVNIFEKDYIFIPVNFNLHWSLLVICHPGEIEKLKDDDVEESAKVPCILHMDSIKGSHSGLKNIIQSYIWEEWKERHPESSDVDPTRFLNLRFVPLELPQQENSFDCGLFLLHYVELFLEEAPEGFNPLKVTKFSSFLNVDWFQPAEASLKRSFIRKLIYKLLDNSSEQSPPATCKNNAIYSINSGNDAKQEPLVELLSEQCTSAILVRNDEFCQVIDTGKEAELLQTSAFPECDKQTRLVLQEFLVTGTTVPLLSNTDHVNQPSCPIVDHKDETLLFATQLVTTVVSPDAVGTTVSSIDETVADENVDHKDETLQFTTQLVTTVVSPDAVGTAVSSIDENVADTVSSPDLFKANAIIDIGDENGKVCIMSPENLSCVQDNSPSSSSGRKSEVHVEDSQDIDDFKNHPGESVRCDTNETGGENDVDCKDINTSIADSGKDKGIRLSNNDDAEGRRQILDLKITEVLDDDQGCPETARDPEIEHCGSPESHSGERRSESYDDKNNQPSASYPDIVITDDEHSSEEDDDVQLMETREEQQPPKRRKVMPIASSGNRRYTRSMTRN